MIGHESNKAWSVVSSRVARLYWSGEDKQDFWCRKFQLIQTTGLQYKQGECCLYNPWYQYITMLLCISSLLSLQLQVLLEWSKERYAARFTVYGDNIGGRSYERL